MNISSLASVRLATAFLCALCAVDSSAIAADPSNAAVVAGWRQSLREVETLLEESKWKPARRRVGAVIDEMEKRYIGGDSAAGFFAAAVFLRSLAAAGLEDDEQAYWDYEMAKALDPRLESAPLSDFGEAGRRLAGLHSPPAPPDAPAADAAGSPDRRPELEGRVVPPEALRKEQPRYLPAQRIGCVEGVVVVQLIIDKAGRVMRPRVLSRTHPVLAYAALDAIRAWRFRPATLNGRPVTVYYNLTSNFRLDPPPSPGSCPDPSNG